MMKAMTVIAAFSAGLCAAPALAHPHFFVDAGVEVIFDAEGRAEAVRITWTYDEFFSLAVVSERGLDADFDGALTADEAKVLTGFDMEWDPGFPGDTYALIGNRTLELSQPEAPTADYRSGRVTSTHLRRFAEPVEIGADPLLVQIYDPTYYTAYTISVPSVLTNAPAGCAHAVFTPDQAAADAVLQVALEEYSGTDGLEADFPAIGAAYADEARITCADPS